MDCDVLVIGGGAAGLSAALVLAQARRRVLVVDAGTPRNAAAAHVHGYLFREGAAPGDLLELGRAEVREAGGEIVTGTVTGVRGDGRRGFEVALEGHQDVRARRLLVATGVQDLLPDLQGLTERWGRDVLHCPYCHGQGVEDQRIGVLGTGPEGSQHALELRQWSHDVTLFQHEPPLSGEERRRLAARDVRVVEEPIALLVVEGDRLTGVRLAGDAFEPLVALFVMPGCTANDTLLTGLGCARDESGWVRADDTGATSVPGVWAAGNVVDSSAQVITAAGGGLTAAVAINADLIEDDVRAALARDRA
ncbi:thioredoxin reductase [Thermocatellispora tengchongensis]|uniref:Thioredoxin reductase n=1 Tax=Thermocatellispora tengchongensis TaxID=1073253 RepID=A0A840PIA8_9ACTN|nr:NAD(P)/FAD-dependent oxidoreductase [Thermocatellispora tengchongensis]MBB5138576.1 thioredoxin reductase [Thermocatellispora tengchongensis]